MPGSLTCGGSLTKALREGYFSKGKKHCQVCKYPKSCPPLPNPLTLKNMPCRWSEAEQLAFANDLKKKRSQESIDRFGIDMTDPNITTRVACEACHILGVSDGLEVASETLRKWYNAHQQIDAERAQRELEDVNLRSERLRRQALMNTIENASLEELNQLEQAVTTTKSGTQK